VVQVLQLHEPQSGERICRRSAAHQRPDTTTKGFSRGYTLPPLRGWDTKGAALA